MTNVVALTVIGAAMSFSQMLHTMNYGVATTNEVTVNITTRTDKAVVLDDDGVAREFIVDAYGLDPPEGVGKCTYIHHDKKCAYWDMYLKRHAIYMERDRLREKWMREEMERQRNPKRGYSPLLNRFRRRVLP